MMIVAMRIRLVVPAKAGTHHAVSSRLGARANTFFQYTRLWLWVPAFAGTTP